MNFNIPEEPIDSKGTLICNSKTKAIFEVSFRKENILCDFDFQITNPKLFRTRSLWPIRQSQDKLEALQLDLNFKTRSSNKIFIRRSLPKKIDTSPLRPLKAKQERNNIDHTQR